MTASAPPLPFGVSCSRGLVRVRSGDQTVAAFMRRVFLPGAALYPGVDLDVDAPANLRQWLGAAGGQLLPRGFSVAGEQVTCDDDGVLISSDQPGAFMALFTAPTPRTTCLESIHCGPAPHSLRVTVGHDGAPGGYLRPHTRQWAFADLFLGEADLRAELTGPAAHVADHSDVAVLLQRGGELTPLLSFGRSTPHPKPTQDYTLWVGARSGWTALDVRADLTGVRLRSSADGPRC